jgi:hypothetical protein
LQTIVGCTFGCAAPPVLFDVTLIELLLVEMTVPTVPPAGTICAPPGVGIELITCPLGTDGALTLIACTGLAEVNSRRQLRQRQGFGFTAADRRPTWPWRHRFRRW